MIDSLVRTWTPMLAGFVFAWLANLGLDLGPGGVGVLTAALGGTYYLLARLVERRWPSLTWLLLSSQQPRSYTEGKPVE